MAELKYAAVPHDQEAFLAKARMRKGFSEAYDALGLEYQVAGQMLKARARAGLTQDAVAERMGRPRVRSHAWSQRASTLRRWQRSSAMQALSVVSFRSSWCGKRQRDAQPCRAADSRRQASACR
jgi:hypothetical protein